MSLKAGGQNAERGQKDFPSSPHPAYHIIIPSMNEGSTSVNESRLISVRRDCQNCFHFNFPYSSLIHEWWFFIHYLCMNDTQ